MLHIAHCTSVPLQRAQKGTGSGAAAGRATLLRYGAGAGVAGPVGTVTTAWLPL